MELEREYHESLAGLKVMEAAVDADAAGGFEVEDDDKPMVRPRLERRLLQLAPGIAHKDDDVVHHADVAVAPPRKVALRPWECLSLAPERMGSHGQPEKTKNRLKMQIYWPFRWVRLAPM